MANKTLTKNDVEKSIDDWLFRISNLYALIETWLKSVPLYTTKAQSEVTMYEALMDKYQLPPRKLKVLDIYCGDNIVATLKPKGLWIIGANGRIDLLSKQGAVQLIDKSERFDKSNWIYYTKLGQGEPLDKEHFLQFLGDQAVGHI